MHTALCMHFQYKIDESHKMLHHYKFISGFVVTTMHSGATHLLSWGHKKNICCKKKFGITPSEIVLTSKWGRIQPEIQIWHVQVVAASWTLVGSPKHAEKMLIQLISATAPSWPAVQCIANAMGYHRFLPSQYLAELEAGVIMFPKYFG